MMMNLQELQTIAHHKLPIKIIVYENDGYLMIKHTQRIGGMLHSSVDGKSGVSLPDFRMLAQDFGFFSCDVWTWDDVKKSLHRFFALREPAMIVFHMDPKQALVPRLMPLPDGSRPRFDQLSPL